MSTITAGSWTRAAALGDAVVDMAMRLAEAERKGAYNWQDETERARWSRAAQRRLRALIRLTGALRDMPFKEEQ